MRIETVEKSGVTVAVVTEGTAIIDATSAMELAMTVRYETGCSHIAIDKKQVCGDFFILSTQLAGGDFAKVHQLPRQNGYLRRLFPLHQQAAA